MKREAKFILDKPKSNEETHIFLKVTCKDSPLKYSTRYKIKPVDWDADFQKTIKNRIVNSELDRLYRIVEQYIESQRLLGNRYIFKDLLKEELDSNNDKKVKVKVNTNNFFTAYDILIKDAEEGTLLTPRKTIYTSGSIKNWKKSKNRFEEFNPNLQFDKITLETYTEFLNYCNLKGYSASYTGMLVKDWKTIMKISHARKWHINSVYSNPDFKSIREESYQVYLTEEEIQRIINVDLSGSKMQAIIRDRYVINLYNGLRVSDMKTLQLGNIQNGMITHINQKTDKKVVIPVHDIVIDIIARYDGQMPKQYHEAVVNREIKKIAQKAELTCNVVYSKTMGGVTKKFKKQKWELITNHTSRRSMATNLLKHVNMQQAMPIMGMSIKTLQLYNKITPEENAERLKENSFFKTKNSPNG